MYFCVSAEAEAHGLQVGLGCCLAGMSVYICVLAEAEAHGLQAGWGGCWLVGVWLDQLLHNVVVCALPCLPGGANL